MAAISGSGMTDLNLPSGSWVTLPWYNKLSDPQGFYNNGAYRVDKRSRLSGVLNLNLNVSCSVNNMPGTLSANGTFQMRMLETGDCYVVRERDGLIERAGHMQTANRKVRVETSRGIKQLLNG